MASPAILSKLNHQFFVIRKEGIEELVAPVRENPVTELIQNIQQFSLNLFEEQKWQSTQTALLIASHLVEHSSPEFRETITTKCTENLISDQNEVREAVATCLGSLARVGGIEVYQNLETRLKEIIETELTKTDEQPEESKDMPRSVLGHTTSGIFRQNTASSSLICMESMITNLGPRFAPLVTDELMAFLATLLSQNNGPVQTGVISIAKALVGVLDDNDALLARGNELATLFAGGMSADYMKTRFIGCEGSRAILIRLDEDSRQTLMPILLGPMSANRHHAAANIKAYSQETFSMLFSDGGRQMMSTHIESIVSYYISEATKETKQFTITTNQPSAVISLGLVAEEIDPTVVTPLVDSIFSTLITCLRNPFASVRKVAASALEKLVVVFPRIIQPQLNEILDALFIRLGDQERGVRENAASCIGKLIGLFPDDVVDRARGFLDENLLRVRDQERVMEPKMDFGSYMYGTQDKIIEPWETTTGAIFLLKELVVNHPFRDHLNDYVGCLVEIADIQDFHAYIYVHAALWSVIPGMAVAIGLKKFKSDLVLGVLLAPMVRSLRASNATACAAAGQCVEFCYTFLGERLFEGRLNDEQTEIVMTSKYVTRT